MHNLGILLIILLIFMAFLVEALGRLACGLRLLAQGKFAGELGESGPR